MMNGLHRILFAEDDADIRSIVTLALSRLGGFEVTAVPDGPTALAAAAAERPDLVILDFMMPGMDGLQTLAALRKAIPGADPLPAIFVTAAVAAQGVADLQGPGVLGVIPKPFDALALPMQIQAMWDRHHHML
jgi:CheY-like chemotaxis protein